MKDKAMKNLLLWAVSKRLSHDNRINLGLIAVGNCNFDRQPKSKAYYHLIVSFHEGKASIDEVMEARSSKMAEAASAGSRGFESHEASQVESLLYLVTRGEASSANELYNLLKASKIPMQVVEDFAWDKV